MSPLGQYCLCYFRSSFSNLAAMRCSNSFKFRLFRSRKWTFNKWQIKMSRAIIQILVYKTVIVLFYRSQVSFSVIAPLTFSA